MCKFNDREQLEITMSSLMIDGESNNDMNDSETTVGQKPQTCTSAMKLRTAVDFNWKN